MRTLEAALQPTRSRALTAKRAAHGGREPTTDLLEPMRPATHIRDHQLSGARGRRSAQIRDKVRDGEVDLMADAGDDRRTAAAAAAIDRARDALVVECPQILERAAPTGEDQHVALGARCR